MILSSVWTGGLDFELGGGGWSKGGEQLRICLVRGWQAGLTDRLENLDDNLEKKLVRAESVGDGAPPVYGR